MTTKPPIPKRPLPLRLHIQYFALLREQRGLESETLETAAPTPAALYAELAQNHGFTLPASALQVALNDDFASWSAPLSPGDSVAFLPPVAGG